MNGMSFYFVLACGFGAGMAARQALHRLADWCRLYESDPLPGRHGWEHHRQPRHVRVHEKETA
jgi:hypothetical protein